MIVLEGGDMTGLVVMIVAIGLTPSIILTIAGFIFRANDKPVTAKVLFIIAAVIPLIGLGICASM